MRRDPSSFNYKEAFIFVGPDICKLMFESNFFDVTMSTILAQPF